MAAGSLSLGGTTVALVTPLDESGEVDRDGLERLLARLAPHRLTAVSPAGSTGEGPLLARATRVELVKHVREGLAPGVAVLAGAVATSVADVREDLEAYAAAGADAALVPPPYYFRHDPDDVERYYELVLGFSPLPIVFYNIPQLTKVQVPVRVVERLAGEERVAGIKDSSGDLEYFSSVLAARPAGENFAALTGTDTLLVPSLLLGGSGTIAASVNLVPEMATSIQADVARGELDAARATQRRLLEVVLAVRRAGGPPGWKAALELAGVCSSRRAAPGVALRAEVVERLRAELSALEVI